MESRVNAGENKKTIYRRDEQWWLQLHLFAVE